jgi:hypothetical protein
VLPRPTPRLNHDGTEDRGLRLATTAQGSGGEAAAMAADAF